MKLYKYVQLPIVAILVTSMGIGSCKKFLQQESFNNISTNEIFQDFEGARTTLVGCYDNLKSASYYSREMSVYADIVGGNAKYPIQSNQILWNSYNFNNDAGNNDLKLLYEAAYNNIYRANNILENIVNVKDANEVQLNTMKADAYMFRALGHFDLVRIFAQAPSYSADRSHAGIYLRLKNTSGISQLPPVNSVKEVYEAIVKDVDSARFLYQNSTNIYGGVNQKFFFNRNAATALLSRIELYNENNQRVIDLATELLPLTGLPTVTLITNANQYITAWRGKNSHPESLMEIQFNNTSGLALGNSFNFSANNPTTIAATNDLLNSYTLTNDVRNRQNLFKRVNSSGVDYFFTQKYLGTVDSTNHIKLIRISEVYLNRAEAYAKINMLSEALTDLNKIRRARTGVVTAVNDYNPASPTQQMVIDEILNERRRELCFEGHYMFDLARNKKSIIRNDCQAIMNCNVTYPSPKYVVPIPIN